jgi:plasmid stabilization system protein ParE
MSFPFEITPAAEKDLADIFTYTENRWGYKQAHRYASLLQQCFYDIAANLAVSRVYNRKLPNIRMCRCERHRVFFVRPQPSEKAIIIAILHERMNFMSHLQKRIS